MCGIVGAVGGDPGDLELFINSLCRVNNRGHEAVGVAARAAHHNRLLHHRHWGMVREACIEDRRTFRNFTRSVIERHANAFVGHTRYSTVGPSDTDYIQPMPIRHPIFGEFVVAHNGQIVNHETYARSCEEAGHRFRTVSDSEMLTAMIALSKADNLVDAVKGIITKIPGVYSFIAMDHHCMVAARDCFGVRPLWFNHSDDHFYVASECAALAGTSEACEVNQGALVCFDFDQNAWQHEQVVPEALLPPRAHCILEPLYFSRPDQKQGNSVTSRFRRAMGELLAQECPVEADIVCGVPDSGRNAAFGFARSSGIDLEPDGIIRNFFSVSGRSFILPEGRRIEAARMKYAVSPVVEGKDVAVVDDTIVRATTMPVLVQMLRAAGARKIHVRVAAPPVRFTCDKGIDIPTKEELPASRMSEEEIREMTGADSLRYLSYDGMMQTANGFAQGWCAACFDGKCPVKLYSLT